MSWWFLVWKVGGMDFVFFIISVVSDGVIMEVGLRLKVDIYVYIYVYKFICVEGIYVYSYIDRCIYMSVVSILISIF